MSNAVRQESVFFLPGNQELAKSNERWDETAAEASHSEAPASDISVKVTEMLEGVVTSSQVPAVCVAPEGDGAFSTLSSPPSSL